MTEMTQEAPTELEASAAEGMEGIQNSDSSTETQAEDKAQVSDNAQKRINELTAEKYALKKQLEQVNQKPETQAVEQEKALEVAPQLPDDIYDETAMRKYHADMITFSTEQAKKAAESTYQEQQKTAQQATQQQETQKVIQDYAQNGLNDGLTIEKMQLNEQVLNGSGISAALGQHLMTDPNGAKVADYLASNHAELQKVVSMNPMQAAVYIANEVKIKALGPSNISKAPAPIDVQTNGSSIPVGDEFATQCPGAQFD